MAISNEPSRGKLPRQYIVIIVIALSVLLTAYMLLHTNGFLSFGLHQPKLKRKSVYYLCAKFGPTKDEFAKQVERHVNKVLGSGVFREEEIICYTSFPSFITEDPTWKYHLQFLEDPLHESRRGGGYWFWKPLLIHYHLGLLEDGDFLLFSDVDRENFLTWTPLLLKTMEAKGADLAIEQMSHLEREWTKNDSYDLMCPGLLPQDDNGGQYNANFVLLQKNVHTVKFIDDWMVAATNYHLISDKPSQKLNFEGFKENRHDQSMLSLLIRCAYAEPGKTFFEWTCLGGDLFLYTFQLHLAKNPTPAPVETMMVTSGSTPTVGTETTSSTPTDSPPSSP